MNTKTDITDLIVPQADSTDPDYPAWKDAKIEAALAEARANPDQRISQAEIWAHFSRES